MSIQQNHAQQIPVRNFRVNYDGGFALLQNTALLGWIIENNSGVNVVEVPSIEQAYVEACRQFVKKEWAKNPYQNPILPRFEDVIRSPYHASGFVSQIPAHQFFAAINSDYVAIYNTVQGAIDFADYFKPSGLQEFSSAEATKNWLNEKFLLPIFAISAYVTDKIGYIQDLPLNTAAQIYYRQWWQQHLPAVGNLPFV